MELSVDQYRQVVDYIKSKIDDKDTKQDSKLEELSLILKEYVLNNIKKNKFSMYYQPKYNNDNKTFSAEALFRMKNFDNIRDTGKNIFVDPEVAFYYINEAELISDVIKCQVEKICSDLKNNSITDKANLGEPNYRVSINVPLIALNEDFIAHLNENLNKNNLCPNNIQIEILETENFGEMNKYLNTINKLKESGVTFALDDFGSRNANTEALRSIEFDSVKIDKSLLDEAKNTNDYSAIKKKYEEIKQTYPNATVVIEGVEGVLDQNGDRTKSFKNILKHLREIGEMEYQGWGFSKAVPSNELAEKIHKQNSSSPSGLGE